MGSIDIRGKATDCYKYGHIIITISEVKGWGVIDVPSLATVGSWPTSEDAFPPRRQR